MADIGGIKFAYSYIENTKIENVNSAKLVSKAGGSYLVAMALLLGKIANNMTENLMDLAKELDKLQAAKSQKLQSEGYKGNGSEIKGVGGMGENELTALMQAQTQLLNMFMQAMNTVIKSMGEANRDVARKQ